MSKAARKLENSGEKQTERGAYPKSALRAAAPSVEGVKKTRMTVRQKGRSMMLHAPFTVCCVTVL